MIYLVLSVIISSFLYVIFKLFDRFNIHTFQAIVINYLVAATIGFVFFPNETTTLEIASKPWFIGTVLLGILFIAVFNIMALTSQQNGVSVASVSSKMSIVIPILFALFVYQEKLNTLNVMGIFMALLAVYLTAMKSSSFKKNRSSLKKIALPLLLFLGSGIIDTSLKYLETNYVAANDIPIYTATIFLCAFCMGIIIMIYQYFKNTTTFYLKSLLGGLALGIPNYFSVYFLLRTLQSGYFNSSVIFTINNVAIVALSTFWGILLFRERLNAKNWIGIGLAILSILLVAL